LTLAVAGCGGEGFDPVEGAREVEGVYYSPLDNPIVTGTVNGIAVLDRAPPSPTDNRYAEADTFCEGG